MPSEYRFTYEGACYQMNYSEEAGKIVTTGYYGRCVTTMDFDPVTGVLSNEQQLCPFTMAVCFGARFSPDGSKLYVSVDPPAVNLMQYDFNTQVWTKMNTCCFAHDLKTGPDGRMYHIRDYKADQPIAVIEYPNRSAVNNACGYHELTFPSAFTGEVRRFPEFITLPKPPVANTDIYKPKGPPPYTVPVMANDYDPQGDALSLESIITPPKYGTVSLNGGFIVYTPVVCNKNDTFTYRIQDINCASDTAEVVIIGSSEAPVIYTDPDLCLGDTIMLSTRAVPGRSYHWNGPGGFTSNAKDVFIYPSLASHAGLYTLWVSDNGCKSDMAHTSVLLYTILPLRAGNDLAVCRDSKLVLTASGVQSASYHWNGPNGFTSSLQNPVIDPVDTMHAGTYTVSISKETCGSDTLKTQVDVLPRPPVFLGNDTAVCPGSTVTLAAKNRNMYMNYLWQDQTEESQFTANDEGTYWLTVTDSNWCRNTDTLKISLFVPVKIKMPSQIRVCERDTLIGPQNKFDKYLWQDGSVGAQLLVSEYGTYRLVVTDSNTCTDSASLEVISNCAGTIYVPSAFSPNGDGLNDVFYPVVNNMSAVYVQVYNRWGQLVFSTQQPNHGWDGTFEGVPAGSDTYTYYITATDILDNVFTKKGDVTLLR